jgi:hypothetical protein
LLLLFTNALTDVECAQNLITNMVYNGKPSKGCHDVGRDERESNQKPQHHFLILKSSAIDRIQNVANAYGLEDSVGVILTGGVHVPQ